MPGNPPAAPAREGQKRHNRQYSSPLHPRPSAKCTPAVLHVFREGYPFLIAWIARAGLPATLVKAPHPGALFQADHLQVAAQEAAAEDSSRKFFKISRLQSPDVLRGDLGARADGLQCDPPLFAGPPQLLPECRQSVPRATLSQTPLAPTLSDRHCEIKGFGTKPTTPRPLFSSSALLRLTQPVRSSSLDHLSRRGCSDRLKLLRLPFPERIPINRAAIFAVVLFAVQRVEGTPLYFCAGCLVFILIATLAFNTAGGLTRASGAYVLFYSLLVVIIGVCYKAYIGEAADRNLADPKTDIEVYVAGISTMFLAVIVSRRFSAKRAVFQSFLREQDMQAASVGCMVTGFLASSAIAILGSAAVQLERTFAQLNQLVSLGIIIGVMHEIRSSGGRRSVNLIIALAIGYQFYAYGLMGFSKQGMILPFFCWFLPVCALRYRLSWVQMGICLLGAFLLFHYLYPYAQYGRSFVNEQTTAEQRKAVVLNLISHPERTRQLAEPGGEDQPRGLDAYYNTPQGFWDRLQFISADDALVSFTDQGHVFGLYPIEAAILNAVRETPTSMVAVFSPRKCYQSPVLPDSQIERKTLE